MCGERGPVILRTEGWVGPRVILDITRADKSLLSLPITEKQFVSRPRDDLINILTELSRLPKIFAHLRTDLKFKLWVFRYLNPHVYSNIQGEHKVFP